LKLQLLFGVSHFNPAGIALTGFSTIIVISFNLAGGEIPWDYVHGLFDQAIYGGRVDNPVDTDVLRSYLIQYFNSAIIGGSKGSRNKLTANVNIPNSSDLSVRDFKRI
jgi:hypothetical protein